MKMLRFREIRWTTWAGLTMMATALAIFMTFPSSSQAYAFDEWCKCDGQYDVGKCVSGQRCMSTETNICFWADDDKCPCTTE